MSNNFINIEALFFYYSSFFNSSNVDSPTVIDSPNFHILHTNPHIKVTAEVFLLLFEEILKSNIYIFF